MKSKTFEEFGKGLLGFANLIGGFSLINTLFGNNHNLPIGITFFVVLYITVGSYIAGLKLIDKGEE